MIMIIDPDYIGGSPRHSEEEWRSVLRSDKNASVPLLCSFVCGRRYISGTAIVPVSALKTKYPKHGQSQRFFLSAKPTAVILSGA